MKTAEEIYTEWFGGDSHTTRRSLSKRNIIAAMEEYAQQSIDMYKECLEQFVTTDKWDEATEFLSSYGSGLAKDLKRREK